VTATVTDGAAVAGAAVAGAAVAGAAVAGAAVTGAPVICVLSPIMTIMVRPSARP